MHRESRLRRSADFDRARSGGRGWSHDILVCYVFLREEPGPLRVGIIVSRRVGNAVVRNLVKRRIREATRALYPELAPQRDLVVIARPKIVDHSLADIRRTLYSLFRRAGLTIDPETAKNAFTSGPTDS
ncbi:MAG: ribonuclease P protein component [Chloroflexi bacterium]|nr:ribonuclease P protein component [Chloroflexota bacterium]